ncbi:NAD(P)-dependent oxidoreductase [Amycolatopsis acidiphila]|uniref:NAD(P)-dependent oxidoreductase n=1 Tax=Amycolatopsis acidiphila TaxID=715473 RepID=A0A558AIL5_9PSEU|nr:NAD(P)-dependent oxidoreductase [Amycolatopsis acidiphila]TVT24108.1 NAD(P)-dependent oxidoreductase [Amycolatopsis acidiphila]UIJ57734.1 NAD(P)-dependent oxidoreductase [Amycolatopsis acidiphila]GHG87368.1 tartronate semialdehyde reductase [Amycolatopsis acidiphila]
MSKTTVGFIGVGRLGFPLAAALADAGFPVVCTNRGRAEEIVARGATIPGDGTARAVAEAADVVVSCLPSVASLEEVTTGPGGVLSAGQVPPLIEASTFSLTDKARIRAEFTARGAELFDAPVSGTPAMVEARMAVIYASGDQGVHDRFADVFKAMSPNYTYVGDFGTGTKMKLVAQFLGMVHVTAAVEAMAYAKLAGLDLGQVAELISASPGAMSGQFKVRAPLIAAGRFEGRLVTVNMALKDLEEIIAYGEELDAPLDLVHIANEHYRKLAEDGFGEADPGKLFDALLGERLVRAQ